MQMRMNIDAVDVGCYDSQGNCGPNGSWLSQCAKPAIAVKILKRTHLEMIRREAVLLLSSPKCGNVRHISPSRHL